VRVADSELHVERRGEGEPLLLVQGLGCHTAHWGEPFLAELERDFELILYDHRGIGRSAPLRSLAVPTLVLHGTADEILEAVNGDLIASLILARAWSCWRASGTCSSGSSPSAARNSSASTPPPP